MYAKNLPHPQKVVICDTLVSSCNCTQNDTTYHDQKLLKIYFTPLPMREILEKYLVIQLIKLLWPK